MPTFGTRKSAILQQAPLSERALCLGDILGKPARVLCSGGEITSVRNCLYRGADESHPWIIVDDITVDGEPQSIVYMIRDDCYFYGTCICMLNAQEMN